MHGTCISFFHLSSVMDDVAALIAAEVVRAVDGVLWDWDDVAAAAAALSCSGTVPLALSTALWRELSAAPVLKTAAARRMWLRRGCLVSGVVKARVSKAQLCALAQCSGACRRACTRGAKQMGKEQLRCLLQDTRDAVGRHVPLQVRDALVVRGAMGRWTTAYKVERTLGVPMAALLNLHPRCRSLRGCMFIGGDGSGSGSSGSGVSLLTTHVHLSRHYLLRDVRVALRRAHDASLLDPMRLDAARAHARCETERWALEKEGDEDEEELCAQNSKAIHEEESAPQHHMRHMCHGGVAHAGAVAILPAPGSAVARDEDGGI